MCLIQKRNIKPKLKTKKISQVGLEPTTFCLEGKYSIQLNYWDHPPFLKKGAPKIGHLYLLFTQSTARIHRGM